MKTEIKKAAIALGINSTNIDKVENLINGVNIYVKNRQYVCSSDMGEKNYMYAHHSQISKYRDIAMKDIVRGCEDELK